MERRKKIGKKISRKKALKISQDTLKNAEKERLGEEVTQPQIGRTDEELKQVAKDLWAGRIFCDRQVSFPKMITSVFMVLVFLKEEDIEKMRKEKVNFIYEYMDKACDRSINGMPMFFSCRMLKEPETKKMFEYYDQFKRMADSL